MTFVDVISFILPVLLVCCGVLWLILLFRLVKMAMTRANIREGLALPSPDNEKVSIVVPAHNEERCIDACIRGLRQQTHREIEIIMVLDRCTDGTAEIAHRHASEDGRVIVIENESCPDDWAGKCNAARIGALRATGNWLLFSDADTTFDPRLVRASIASATKRGASLLSILSTLTTGRFFERLVQPMASTFLVRIFPIDRVNRKHRPRPFANGQFLLFRRDAYESIGGHEAVRDDLLEDIAFAKKMHAEGGRVQLLLADGMLTCSMYDSFEKFCEGWRRIFVEAGGRNPSILRHNAWLSATVGVAAPLMGYLGVALGATVLPDLLVLGIVAVALQLIVTGWLYHINGAPLLWAILAPMGAVVVAKLFLDAASMVENRTPIRWGGREYILEPR